MTSSVAWEELITQAYQCKKVTIFIIIIIIIIYLSFVKTYSVNSGALEMTCAERVVCKILVLKISMSTNPRRGEPIYYLAHVPITAPGTHAHAPGTHAHARTLDPPLYILSFQLCEVSGGSRISPRGGANSRGANI